MHAPVFRPGIFSGRNVSLLDFSPLQWYRTRTDIQSNKCIRGAFKAMATSGGQDGVSTASADAQSVFVGLCHTHTHTQVSSNVPQSGTPRHSTRPSALSSAGLATDSSGRRSLPPAPFPEGCWLWGPQRVIPVASGAESLRCAQGRSLQRPVQCFL